MRSCGGPGPPVRRWDSHACRLCRICAKNLNGAEEDGPEHDARIFGEVTDLFLSNVGRLGDSQIAAVDGVLAHLVGRVEATTVIQLSEALSTIDRAPRETVRKLAFHEQPQVAAPVLTKSSRLSQEDLPEIVMTRARNICWRSPTERRSTKR